MGEDIIGKRFGSLVVLNEVEPSKDKHRRFLCQCDCGQTQIVYATRLRNKKIVMCKQCSYKKLNVKHGLKYTKAYDVWVSIKRRCADKSNKDYGGRGISVCKEWINNPVSFCDWYNKNYKKNCTIDRIDNSKGYSPENCRFATLSEQGCNKRNNVLIENNGEVKTASQWAKIVGISSAAMSNRYARHGNDPRIFEKQWRDNKCKNQYTIGI